jgi:hypothetical protein
MKVRTTRVADASPSDGRLVRPVDQESLNAASDVDGPAERRKIHRLLLVESMRRLRSGRQLERAHGVIHPELTCIIRDVLRLAELVFPGSEPPPEALEGAAEVRESSGAVSLAALAARGGWARVAKVSGLDVARLKRIAAGADVPDAELAASLEGRLQIPSSAWGAES